MSLFRTSLFLLLFLAAAPADAQSGGRGYGGVREEARILKRYDKDGDGVLNAAERRAALTDFGFDLTQPLPPATGERLTSAQVKRYGSEPLYDPAVLRTLFLTFDSPTWEDELTVFRESDVKVPASLEIDGKVYRDVGVSFRGQMSFRGTSAGQKRSLNLDIDFRQKAQRVLGNTRLILLNSAQDASFLRTVMYMQVARDYYPAYKANYMRVVINGENWGIYVNQQPADAVYALPVGGSEGPIWKVPGAPGARGGLEYWGEDAAPYQRVFQLTHNGNKSTAEAWQVLINLCRVLNQTPADRLQAALAPIMDVDQALRFLAVDNALMNGDGYYSHASEYNLFVDGHGRFHFVTHDANEAMRPADGFGHRGQRGNDNGGGGGRGPGPGGIALNLEPLAGADQPGKALLYRLLAVPEFRQRYLGYVRDVSDKWLNWNRFGTVARSYQTLIADDVRRDAHKLYSTDAFMAGLENDLNGGFGMGGTTGMSLKSFVEQRHAFLTATMSEK